MHVEGEHLDEPSVIKQIVKRPSAGDFVKVANVASMANLVANGIKGDLSWSNFTKIPFINIGILNWKKTIPSLMLLRDSYTLGEHGSIFFRYYTGPRKVLSDGTLVKPGSKVGEINLTKDIPKKANLNVHEFSVELLKDFIVSLIKLAQDSKNGKFPDDIHAIFGVSHLVGDSISRKLGFDVMRPLLHEKISGVLVGLNMSTRKNVLQSKWKNTQKAFISVKKICENEDMYRKLLKTYTKRFG